MESGKIEVCRDMVAEKLDEMADICEYWKRRREQGITPNAIRAALLMLANELVLLQDVHIPEKTNTVTSWFMSSFGESAELDLPQGADLILACVNYSSGDCPRSILLPHQLYRNDIKEWLSENRDIRSDIKSIVVYPLRGRERIDIPLKNI